MIEQVRNDPAMPIHWGKNQPGMQANEELAPMAQEGARQLWMQAARDAASVAQVMADVGLHKQVANRILEPYQYMHVIVTATEWENFFELRNHPDAQPEIHALAKVMHVAFAQSRAVELKEGDWHLPYVTRAERLAFCNDLDLLLKLSGARCARVSYLTHDGQTPSVDKALYDRLVGSKPLHASPIEHQATPLPEADMWSGNFRGWLQNRKIVENAIEKTS
jgi:hypothetical protein